MRRRKADLIEELEEMRRRVAELEQERLNENDEEGDEQNDENEQNNGENEEQDQNNGAHDDMQGNGNYNQNQQQNNEIMTALERMHQQLHEAREEMQHLRQENAYLQAQSNNQPVEREDENMRELQKQRLASKNEQSKFENVTKRIGPFDSKLNSAVWVQRLEVEREAENLSWEYFLRSIRHFFTTTSDVNVKTWFERKETVWVPQIMQAKTDERRKFLWESFKGEFISQYDPEVRAQLAEDKYEQFELTSSMSAEEYVNQLQDIILETDPFMLPAAQVRKMHRKLPVDLRAQITHPSLSSVPMFLQRLQNVLQAHRKLNNNDERNSKPIQDQKEKEKEIQSGISAASSSASEALSLRTFQGQCYHCNKFGHKSKECRGRKQEENSQMTSQGYNQQQTTRGLPFSYGRGMTRGSSSFRGSFRGRGNFRGQPRGGFQPRGGYQPRAGFQTSRGYQGRGGFYSRGGGYQGDQESRVRNIVQEVLQTQPIQPGLYLQQPQAIAAPGYVPQVLPQVQNQNQPQGLQGIFGTKPENY